MQLIDPSQLFLTELQMLLRNRCSDPPTGRLGDEAKWLAPTRSLIPKPFNENT